MMPSSDTIFVSQVEAYNRLSPVFRAFLETLEVEHSGFEQAAHSRSGKRGGIVKREPVKNVHPFVRRACPYWNRAALCAKVDNL